jgi:lysozyme
VKTSQAGVDLIKLFEGVSFNAYVCPAGVLTIGYGHTGPDVKPGQHIEGQKAEILLRKDLQRFEDAVSKYVKVPLNQHQFDALVSFAFNVGEGALADSTLLKRLNAKEDPNTVAKEELIRWNKGDGGKVLEGLTRRRAAEIELFCQAAPQIKIGTIDITSKQQTWLKKRPVLSTELTNDEKAKVYQGRTIKNCKVLDKKDKHTFLELGFGLGKWWVYDAHWDGLITKTEIKPYAVDGFLHYLRNFPYFYQQDNGPEGWRQCQTSCIAMCLRYLDVPGIHDDKDYLKIVNKYGDTTRREPHYDALEELGVYAKFTVSADEQDVKDEIDKGIPVVAGILHHGAVSHPTGDGHFIVITGYDDKSWLVQDPYGELDLINGSWAATGAVSGKNIRYSFKNLNPRLFVNGGATGWCWMGFARKPR